MHELGYLKSVKVEPQLGKVCTLELTKCDYDKLVSPPDKAVS